MMKLPSGWLFMPGNGNLSAKWEKNIRAVPAGVLAAEISSAGNPPVFPRPPLDPCSLPSGGERGARGDAEQENAMTTRKEIDGGDPANGPSSSPASAVHRRRRTTRAGRPRELRIFCGRKRLPFNGLRQLAEKRAENSLTGSVAMLSYAMV
jgi:hypothetical protein